MLLYCCARPRDKTMALGSMAIVDEHDRYVFEASEADDPAVVRKNLRDYVSQLTQLDGGRQPQICIEGFGRDMPVERLVVERAHGLFESGMGMRVNWFDIYGPQRIGRPDLSALENARLIRDTELARRRARPDVTGTTLPVTPET